MTENNYGPEGYLRVAAERAGIVPPRAATERAATVPPRAENQATKEYRAHLRNDQLAFWGVLVMCCVASICAINGAWLLAIASGACAYLLAILARP